MDGRSAFVYVAESESPVAVPRDSSSDRSDGKFAAVVNDQAVDFAHDGSRHQLGAANRGWVR